MRRSPVQVVDDIVALVLGGLGHLETNKRENPSSTQSVKEVEDLAERLQMLEAKVASLEETYILKETLRGED